MMINPIAQFQQVSNAPISYDKLNKVVYIGQGVDKDGKELDKLRFDLNKKSDYIRLIDTMILNSSFGQAKKDEMLMAAKKWIEENSSIFETKPTDITSENLLGLPTF